VAKKHPVYVKEHAGYLDNPCGRRALYFFMFCGSLCTLQCLRKPGLINLLTLRYSEPQTETSLLNNDACCSRPGLNVQPMVQ
jgi:hypothetical protein